MASAPSTVDDLLDRADAARTAGRGDDAARLYAEASARCRAGNDLDGWTRAALGSASVYLFGADPGRIPAELHDVLVRTTDDATRARLAAALARCWSYAGRPERGARFADEAVDRAGRAGSPELLADCLDAALAAHWGPDELELRRTLAARLDEVTAHVSDPDVRLQAHLWGLQVSCDVLDVQGIHRQMRALERLGERSPRARFFAASRRLMLDLMQGRTDSAGRLTDVASEAAGQAGLADAWMVVKAMGTYSAAVAGDRAGGAAAAAEMEAFGLAEAITVVCAEAAFVWACLDRTDRARTLVHTFHAPALDELPRDVNWLLTLQCVLEAALAADDRQVIASAYRLLRPYEGRAVFNAGAVMFHGVTDDPLSRAAAVLGDPDTADRLRAQAQATYERLGAHWWLRRLGAGPAAPDRMVLRPIDGGVWLIGPERNAVPVRALRGFGYLRELLRHPGREISALDLAGGGTPVVAQPGLGETLDKRALAAYRERLRQLDAEIAEAEDWSDIGRLDAARAEREALIDELARATGLGGRARTAAGSSRERARIATRKAVSAAVDRIAAIDEPLADHLRRSIRTGLSCSYEPGRGSEVEWVLD